MALSIAFILVLAATSVYANRACCGGKKQLKEPKEYEITVGVRSYTGDYWFTNDNRDVEYKTAFEASGKSLKDYVESLPKRDQPQLRNVTGGKTEYYIINEGNSYVLVRDLDTNERHGYLISSDGYHAVDTAKEDNPLELLPGTNYKTTLYAKTKPTTFEDVYKTSKSLGEQRKNGFNQEYKGTYFTIELVLAIINDEGRKLLMESSANWPPALQRLDAHFKEHIGQSAFQHHKIPEGKLPTRASIDVKGGNTCLSGVEAE